MDIETKTIDFSNRLYKASVVLLIGVLIMWAMNVWVDYKALSGNYPQEITVSAEGKATITPDIALVVLGVATEGMKIENIVPENTDKMNAILKVVKDLGIEEKDIQTTNYSLSPRYDYLESGTRVFRGYTLSQEIKVKVKDFTKIGNVLEKGTANGANVIGSLQFSVDDTEKVRELAKKDAIAKAKAQAKLIAKEAGIKLGKVKNVYENYYPVAYGYGIGGATSAMKESSAVSAPPQIQPGEQEFTVQISLVYQVK